MSILDELAPLYVGSESLKLSLAEPNTEARAFRSVTVLVDYSGAGEDGVQLPLELRVTGPSAESYVQRFFRRTAPSELSFTPKEGGSFLVLLREVAHNRRRGKLVVQVAGERIT